MENLLDDIDGLVAPGLSTDTPDWCVNCQSLRQEVKQLKEEHCQNFGRLKQKIINTDLLIKKFKAKCDDFDLQCKKTEEANKRADKFQRQCEILETQLKAALIDTEPLRKTKVSLEEELNAKKAENQMLSDRLIATESAWKQYEHLSKANSSSLEAMERENKELLKKIKLLESGKVKTGAAKELKSEMVILKKENSSLKKENSSLKNIEERLQKRLLLANKNIDSLNKSLKEKVSSPRIHRRGSPIKSPFHSPRLARYTSPTKSPVRFNSPIKSPVTNRKLLLVSGSSRRDVPSTPAERTLDFDDDSSIDDSDDGESSVAWTFSPITQCISPLPPSPACFINQVDVDGEVSDIADDLEEFLHDDEDKEQVGNEENEGTHIDNFDLPNNDEADGTSMMDVEKPVSNDTGDVCDGEEEPHVDVSDTWEDQPNNQTNRPECNVPESHHVIVEQENSHIKSLDTKKEDIITDKNDHLMKQERSEVKSLDSKQQDINTDRNKQLPDSGQENSQVKSLDNTQHNVNTDRIEQLLEHGDHPGQTLGATAISKTDKQLVEHAQMLGATKMERMAGAHMQIISPKAFKKVSSPIRKCEGKNDKESVQNSTSQNVWKAQTMTRSPAIRRSARIKSKRDSETSEVESDSNIDKISPANPDISERQANIDNTDKTEQAGPNTSCLETLSESVQGAEDNTDQAGQNTICPQTGPNTSCSETVRECVQDDEDKSENNASVQDADISINPESVIKKDNLDKSNASINLSESVKLNKSLNSDCDQNNLNTLSKSEHCSVKEKEKSSVDSKVKTSELAESKVKTSEFAESKGKTSECVESNEVEVWREVQTLTVSPKPLPNRSCLLRQKAVTGSHKVGHSHLFDDLQAMRGKAEKCKDSAIDKNKSKFGAHKFIPFQHSSEGTLSNEIDNLHSAHDYEVISRKQTENQVTERPELSRKDKKKLRRKMRKNCKYIDRDSEVYGHNNNNNNIISYTNISPAERLDSKLELTINENSIVSRKDVVNHIVESTETCVSRVSDKLGTVGDNDKTVTDSAACRTTNEVFNTLQVPGTDGTNDGSDKVVPSRQLSTGFSVNSVSLERASSTESGVSLRSSPARLCMLETGSCDTIVEQVYEHVDGQVDEQVNAQVDGLVNKQVDKQLDKPGNKQVDEKVDKQSNSCTHLTKDKCDDKDSDPGPGGDNLIFGVEDIMDSDHGEPCDKSDRASHSFLLKGDNTDLNSHSDEPVNTRSVKDNLVSTQSGFQSTHTDMFASYIKPGCSGYNTKTSANDSFKKSKDEKLESVVEEFGDEDYESSRSSTQSFSMLGRDSPLSDMFLSRFEFLNPVSPLPPSPVRELEDYHCDETGGIDFDDVDESGEFENETEFCKIEISSFNDSNVNDSVCDISLSSSTSSSREGCLVNKSNSKGKALKKKSIGSANKSASSYVTRNTSVKTSSGGDNSIRITPGTPEAFPNIKVEHLKLSPLPGMISPLRSPAVKKLCKNKPMNRIHTNKTNVKIERNIMTECDRIVKSEADDTLVAKATRTADDTLVAKATRTADDTLVAKATRSKTSIDKQSNSSSTELGASITKKRKGSLSKKSKTTADTDTGAIPVRKSALVDKILRQRAETVKEKLTPFKREPGTKSTPTDNGESNYDHSEPSDSQNVTIVLNHTKSLNETCNVKSDVRKTLAVMKSDTSTIAGEIVSLMDTARVVDTARVTDSARVLDTATAGDTASVVVDTAKENADSQGIEQDVSDAVDEKGNQNVLEELPTGHDNLAFKRKTRVAHKPNMMSLKPPKVPIIDAPHLPPVLPGRKRRSTEAVNNFIQDKKPCKKSSFRRQKNESCLKKEDTRRMQAFLKSTETADKLVTIVTDIHGADCGNILLLSCLECIGRVMTDPLDVVFENCVTDAYHSIHTDFPFLSDVEKRAVYLICHLIDNKYIKKDKLMRSTWDTVLCRNLSVNVIGKMAQCRLFIALCAVQGDLELARVMVYQIVTCTHLNFILFIIPVISVWPEVLRKKSANCPDLVLTHGLTLVLEELITERLLAMDDELSKKVLLVLKKLCLWSGISGNSETILKTLVTELQTCTSDDTPNHGAVFELTKAINLLCASKSWNWVKGNFIERHGLQPAAYKYTAKLITKQISPVYMCALLKVTSYILSVHAATIREKDYQQIIRNWLLPVLYKKPGDDTVHLCCVETLIELTPLYPTCLDMIHRWYQEVRCMVSEELTLRLEDLRIQYKQQFGLVCKPFTKS